MSWPRVLTHHQLWVRALRGLAPWRLKKLTRPKARPYIAEGGPYHGQKLMLVDGNTARFRAGKHVGQYRCGLVADKRDNPGTTKWHPANG